MINDTNLAISYFYLTIGGTLYYCVTLLVSELSQKTINCRYTRRGSLRVRRIK
jgi:hypothetical protein